MTSAIGLAPPGVFRVARSPVTPGNERMGSMALSRTRRTMPGTDRLVWLVISIAWGAALLAVSRGADHAVGHDVLVGDGRLPPLGELLRFLGAWQVMTAAMMLPSSRPMVRLFSQVSRSAMAVTAFVSAYFAVWTAFALVALAGDAMLHNLVERSPWLHDHPAVITGGVLLFAGAFQFSPLKDRCLHACRTPYSFLMRHYGRGIGPAWSLGVRHGLFCLGCCWALMLTMFGVGVSNLAWMVVLTGVMVIEKTATWGRRLVPLTGATLMASGLVLVMRAF